MVWDIYVEKLSRNWLLRGGSVSIVFGGFNGLGRKNLEFWIIEVDRIWDVKILERKEV